jgi:tetratricopeptide (TPR) repeat protein
VKRVLWLRWGLGAAAAITLVAVVGALARRTPAGGGGLPPPPHPAPDSGPAFEDFVGAETCGQCHASQFEAWSRSTHGRAGGAPSRTRVIAPFNGPPIRFRDAMVTPAMTEHGRFTFIVAQNGRPVRTFQVDAVVGGGFMAGGGTQTFFSSAPDGTLRYLPFDYSRAERRWFCPPRRANQGWLPITPAIALADCGDWPPRRILGSSARIQSCQQCHGSQIEVAFDTSTRRYETRFATLAINCESCHGPGRGHVELAGASELAARPRPVHGHSSSASADAAEPRLQPRTDIGMRPLATLTKDQSLEVCFQCHAVKTALAPNYLTGRRLQEHFALKLPLLLDTIYHPDGRTRSFGYQEGHLASDCYLNGSMTCVDCHDPHTQRYRDVNGSSLPGRVSDGQCLGCHASKAEPLEQHTHHRAASAGSRCVSCHMPYLQQPSVGRRIRYARSDHAIPIPRPVHDGRLGVENACQQCHRDRTVQELQDRVTAWYGELKPHPAAVAQALAAREMSDPAAAARAIFGASGGEAHPWAEFAGLAQVIQRYARPDMAALDAGTIDDLERRATSADPDVQALALATLHLVRGADPEVRRFLARQLRALGSRDGVVRNRWVWILSVRGDAYLAAGDHESALAAYSKALELKPGDPAVLRSLGVVYTRLRDYTRAIEQFRRSLATDPGDPQVLIGLGFALMQQGDLDGAMAAHRRAIATSPWDPAGYANLALVYLGRGQAVPAIDTLRQALALDPGLADAYFLLGRAYAALGRFDEAAAELERGLEFDPRNAAARRMLEALPR